MKDALLPIYSSIKQNKIRAFNYSKTKGAAVCFNLLEIPDTQCTVVTISMLGNRRKAISLDFVSFAKFMRELENRFGMMRDDHKSGFPYYVPLVDEVNKSWYNSLECHRLFLVPTNKVFETIAMLTSDNLRQVLGFNCGIEELSIYVNTSTHNLKISRFNKGE